MGGTILRAVQRPTTNLLVMVSVFCDRKRIHHGMNTQTIMRCSPGPPATATGGT